MLTLVSGLSEGQVLQRLKTGKAHARLTFSGSARGPLTLSVRGKNGKALPGFGNRKLADKSAPNVIVELANLPTGGPYRLEASCGGGKAVIKAFYVGDVWILAGQSNMQGVGNMSGAPKPHPLIHTLTMRREWRQAREPLHLMVESPDACHHQGSPCSPKDAERMRRTSLKGVGPGLFFAHEMLARTGVPQGLIATAHGGTSMRQWTPKLKLDGQTGLYGSMLASVRATGQPIAGLLWYQGESDAVASEAPPYTARMRKLVAASRRDLRQPNLPWIMVQIGRVHSPRPAADIVAWNSIQDQQSLLPKVIPHLGIVASVDLPLDDLIHISAEGQATLAARLAREADRLVLGNRKERPAPALKSIDLTRISRTSGPTYVVTYDHMVTPLRANGPAAGFILLDDEGNDLRRIYKATLHGNAVHLHVSEACAGVRLAYGHDTVPVCTLTDARGHALPVFAARPVGKPQALSPFLQQWRVHPPVANDPPLNRHAQPPASLPAGEVRDYAAIPGNPLGMVNEHPNWSGHAGLGFFSTILDLPEPMRVEFLMGYDGPFRLWVDGKVIYTDMKGINPCLTDQYSARATLAAGRRRVVVGMDLNGGLAWGFRLRFARRDVSPARIRAKDYALPTVHAE